MSNHSQAAGVRRTIDELKTRYRLHPQMVDVYVEGHDDRRLYSAFFAELGFSDVVFYPIESVSVAADLALKIGKGDNNRGRVVALASELAPYVRGREATCIVDADFEDVVPSLPKCPILFRTDFSCLEMYFFEPTCVAALCSRSFSQDAKEHLGRIWPDLESILVELSLFRLANEELRWGLEPLSFSKAIAVSSSRIIFDRNSYLRRYLMKNGKLADQAVFERCITSWRPRLPGNGRFYFNGHDFVGLLSLFLAREHSGHLNQRDVEILVSRTLGASMPVLTLQKHCLFEKLIERFRT